MKKIVLIGDGGHAASCIDVINHESKYSIAGYVGEKSEIGKVKNGYEVIGSDEDIPELALKYKYALVAIGQIKTSDKRSELFEKAKKSGFEFPVIKSPSSYVSSNAVICEGTIIMHGVVINSQVQIGKNCIINSKALIEHGARIMDNTHISTGVLLNGNVVVGKNTFLGSGTIVKNDVKIGDAVLLPMGSLVINNVPDLYQGF